MDLELGYLDKFEGIVLLIFTICYMIFMVKEAKKENEDNIEKIQREIEDDNRKKKKITVFQILMYLLFGAIALKVGADLVVNGAVNIANFFNVTTVVISMTIVAVGTALPEIVTCILATIKDDNDLAIGNIIGSNIFNLALLPAIGSLIKPIKFESNLNFSLLFLSWIVFGMYVSNVIANRKIIGRKKGRIYVIVYIIYSICLVFNMFSFSL